jgi:hypothetical protein
VRVWFTALGVVALVLSLPGGWSPAATTALAQGGAPTSADTALGVIVDSTNPRSWDLAREAGFTHAKMIIHWPRLEPRKGRYAFAETSENDLDNVMKAARDGGLKLVVRVDGTPDWAGGKPAKADPEHVEAFYAAMAAHGKGTIAAYEVLNEPNLPFEWGGSANPGAYTAFLKAAYRGVKKGDPSALVIGGGLSPGAANTGGTMDDLEFLRGMYAAGAKGSMDALAVHNYGGNHEPERDPGDCGICFRRAETYRQIMVDSGDGATSIWATELGWLLDPGRDMGQYDWMRVSAEKQADYIVRAYQYAQKNWPWMTGLLLSNLDASTSGYHTGPQNGMPWFSILNKDYSPRPAWKAFKNWREQERAAAANRPRTMAAPQAIASPSAQPTQAPPTASQDGAGAAPVAQAVPDAAAGQSPPAGAASSTEAAAGPTPVATSVPVGASEGGVVAVAEPATPTPSPSPTAAPAPPAASAPASAASTSSAMTRLRVARTDGTGVNLRSRPAADGSVVAILMEGTTVDVIGEDVQAGGRTWRNVRTTGSTTDGVSGWVVTQYLVP